MIRQRLIKETKKRGLTFTQLADRLGVSKVAVSQMIHCRHDPSKEVIDRLEDVFGIPQRELLAESEERPTGTERR